MVDECNLQRLGEGIGRLDGLEHLAVTMNALTELPTSVCDLGRLEGGDQDRAVR